MDEVLLSARGLIRYYGKQQILHGIDLELHRGEVLGLLGLNGAGKSTTMQILTGALHADAGEVHISGHSLRAMPLVAKRHLGYLPENAPLNADMLVDEFLDACARLRGVGVDALSAAVDRARRRCGLGDVGKRLIGHLSKGYQQRVGIAQAIVHEPSVIVFDEPTSGLDPLQIRDVRALIRELGRTCAVLVSTHILPEVQLLADRILILHGGRIVHDAPLTSGKQWVRARFRHAPAHGALASLPGAENIRGNADDGWLIQTPDGDAFACSLAEHAVSNGWGLIELKPGYDELEERFAEITSGVNAR